MDPLTSDRVVIGVTARRGETSNTAVFKGLFWSL